MSILRMPPTVHPLTRTVATSVGDPVLARRMATLCPWIMTTPQCRPINSGDGVARLTHLATNLATNVANVNLASLR